MPPPPVTPKKMPFEKYRPFLPLPVELPGRRCVSHWPVSGRRLHAATASMSLMAGW